LARLDELVRKVLDLVDNRVEMNLRAIANTILVDLPTDRSFSYDDFIATQNKFQVRLQSTQLIPPTFFCCLPGCASSSRQRQQAGGRAHAPQCVLDRRCRSQHVYACAAVCPLSTVHGCALVQGCVSMPRRLYAPGQQRAGHVHPRPLNCACRARALLLRSWCHPWPEP